MTGFSSSRDELVSSLKAYTSVLAQTNEALSRVWTTSTELRATLSSSDSPDIADALTRRDRDIADYSALCGAARNKPLIDAAVAAANTANDELGEIARSVIALREDSRSIAEQVLACQSECEALLKSRIEATGKAIRQSTQRRKLDAVYGPAVSHDAPVFMDKQR